MGDCIETIKILAEVQENGIIRDSKGNIIGKLVDSIDFEEFVDTNVDMGEISDGYHSFSELYYHRMVLFAVICNHNKKLAWKSWKHADGTMFEDYFIAGIKTPKGDYTYHYHKDYWYCFAGIKELLTAPEWDGHQPKDIDRLFSLTF